MERLIKFQLNRKGVSQLMKSEEMQAILKEKADKIANRCGSGYESEQMIGKKRANARVIAKTYKAKKDNLKNNTILKAMYHD